MGLEAIEVFLINIFDKHLNQSIILVFLADFCKQQLNVFSMEVAMNEVAKVPVEGKYVQFFLVAAASASWENSTSSQGRQCLVGRVAEIRDVGVPPH